MRLNRSPKASGKTLRQVYLQMEIQTSFEFRMFDERKSPEAGANAATVAREARAALIVEALAEAIVMVQSTSYRVPCVWSYQK